MASQQDVTKELNKLSKSELIQIILSRKVPPEVKLSDSSKKYIEGTDEDAFFDAKNDQHALATKTEVRILNMECNLKCAQMEIESYKKINLELERSVSNLEMALKLLHNDIIINNNNLNKNKGDAAKLTQSISTQSKMHSGKPSDEHKGLQAASEPKKTGNRNVVVGNGTNPTKNSILLAADATAILHVSNLKLGTEDEVLKAYLTEKLPKDTNINIEKINTKGTFDSFKVIIPKVLEEQVLNPEFWPKDIKVSIFRFRNSFRNQNGRKSFYFRSSQYKNQQRY